MASNFGISLPSTSKTNVHKNKFIDELFQRFQSVLRYEDPVLLNAAKACIPLTSLQIRAIERMRNIQKKIKTESLDIPEIHLEEAMIIELVNWFKTSFFSWVDCPKCSFCSGPTKASSNTVKIIDGDKIRVEIFKCTLCDVKTDFPRYNDPAKLLITRRGRCGEWGNCFTLLCRSMGYDARIVIDNTDHLWSEVYLPTLKKWLHCDPCENVVDAPLMYEAGWGKKLSYIIAYSRDDVQDVTWKYSSNHKDLLTRRILCNENELISALIEMREKRWETLSPSRIKFVKERLCRELVDMMKERTPTENEKHGRSSGSLDWRLQRKETTVDSFTWKVGNYDEVCIKYRTSDDSYELVQPNGNIVERKKEWHVGVFEMKNMFRKEENDWKMAYLCRIEDSDNAKISWKFEVESDTKIIHGIKINVSSQIYHSGNVDWLLCYNNSCIKIPKKLENNFVLEDIKNIVEFTLCANLSGGNGREAWQHAQILRQSLDSQDFPLQITVSIRNK